MIEKDCFVCGEKFISFPSQKRKYCTVKCKYAGFKGRTPPNKGVRGRIKHSEETRIKLGDILKKVGLSTRFYKGQKPWNTGLHTGSPMDGKKHTEETKDKIRKSCFEKPRKYWLGKENPNMVGEKNPNWKGGITPDNEKERKNIAYYEWRRSVFERDHFGCRVCGARGYMNAHHIQPFRDNLQKRTDINNGITLCVTCHKIMHKREHLFITFLQGILENGLNSVELSNETIPSQQERLRKALWACVTVSGE